MSNETPSLFDNNSDQNSDDENNKQTEDKEATKRPEFNVGEIVRQKEINDARLQSYHDEQALKDQDRIERAAEGGKDLSSWADAQREANIRRIKEIREVLDEKNPDKKGTTS